MSKSLFDKYYSGFVRAPLFWVSALLCLGIALGAKFESLWLYLVMILVLISAALVSLVISARKKIPGMKNVAFGLFCAAVVAFGGFYYRVWLPPREENIVAPAEDDPARIKVRAVKTSELKQNYSRVLCNLLWIDRGRGPQPAQGRLWLNYNSEDMFFPGDELIAWARLRKIGGFRNPLVPDPGLRFARSGIYFSGSQVEEIPLFRVNRLRHFILQGLYRYRTRVQEELDRSGTRSAYLLSAMLLGDRDAVPEEIMKLFQMTNSIHLLVISGFNLSMVAAFIFFIILGFFRIQPWILKRMDPYPPAAVLTSIPITFYAILTGLEVPAFRALIMVWLLLLAVALRKTRDLLNALGLAALIVLLINPSSLLDASFQLSFLAVFVLIPYSPSLWKILGGERLVEEADLAREEKGFLFPKLRLAWLKLLIYFYGLLLATVLIQVFLAPLNAYYFSQFSFSGPFCNLLLVPICGLWVYPLGIAGMVFTEFWPGLADQFFMAAGWGAWLMEKIAWSFSSLPHFNILVRSPFSAEMLGWFAFLFGLLELARIFSRKEKPRTGIILKLLWPALLIVAGAVLSLHGYRELARSRIQPDEARISMLDVGLGQSLLIELPGKKRILIDGGGRLGAINLGQAIVSRFLLARGIHELDMVVLTHPETDHSAGLEYILDRFDVKEFWLPPRFNKISENLLELARKRGIKISWINSDDPPLNFSGATFRFLNPRTGDKREISLNDSSAVIKMDYGSVTILFPGEISSKIESKLIDSDAALLKSRILIAGHHGSKTSSSAQFLDAVSPELILISAGENSQLKLPSSEALLRMSKTGATILRTDCDGEIEIIITPLSTYARTFNGKIIPLAKIGPLN